MRRDVPEVQVGRQPARAVRVGVIVLGGVAFEVRLHERGETAASRPLAAIRRELEFILGTPEIPLPAFLSLPIPLLGTPYFRECVAKGAFLPDTKLRDMDGTTLVLRTRDALPEVVAFLRDMLTLRGYRRRALRHSVHFVRRYRRVLTPFQIAAAMASVALMCAY